ncbi:hypothetical protein PTTG_28245 [Puccinia triticina 1-1 BBBD Race 1]|uniref:Uncharacterized protein n=1 Tax=Puccinia triticina (isolate 1-1 / race 1 (BBBD)) TaxID=630390 RepID=A0A180GDJ4_PUCT1|nr:hypothetical protein PTTG_28245 [Puccinia triticina 1-1 BBBD Race 1]
MLATQATHRHEERIQHLEDVVQFLLLKADPVQVPVAPAASPNVDRFRYLTGRGLEPIVSEETARSLIAGWQCGRLRCPGENSPSPAACPTTFASDNTSLPVTTLASSSPQAELWQPQPTLPPRPRATTLTLIHPHSEAQPAHSTPASSASWPLPPPLANGQPRRTSPSSSPPPRPLNAAAAWTSRSAPIFPGLGSPNSTTTTPSPSSPPTSAFPPSSATLPPPNSARSSSPLDPTSSPASPPPLHHTRRSPTPPPARSSKPILACTFKPPPGTRATSQAPAAQPDRNHPAGANHSVEPTKTTQPTDPADRPAPIPHPLLPGPTLEQPELPPDHRRAQQPAPASSLTQPPPLPSQAPTPPTPPASPPTGQPSQPLASAGALISLRAPLPPLHPLANPAPIEKGQPSLPAPREPLNEVPGSSPPEILPASGFTPRHAQAQPPCPSSLTMSSRPALASPPHLPSCSPHNLHHSPSAPATSGTHSVAPSAFSTLSSPSTLAIATITAPADSCSVDEEYRKAHNEALDAFNDEQERLYSLRCPARPNCLTHLTALPPAQPEYFSPSTQHYYNNIDKYLKLLAEYKADKLRDAEAVMNPSPSSVADLPAAPSTSTSNSSKKNKKKKKKKL